MASNLRNGDYGEFDHNADRSSSGDGKSLLKFLFGFLTNRYLVLSLIFCVFGVIILVMTTRLQFSDYQNKISEGSTGVIRQYVSEAPRGDIYDSRGVLLASTVKYNTIMLANAYLKDDELNSLCLELSNLFERYNCIPVADIDQYFVMEPTPMFVKSDEKIRLWQTDSNLFALEDFSEGVIVTFSDNYVKRDPEVFFLYLRQKFGLDNNYSVEDAYKIIRIRYQLFAEGWSFIKGTPVKIATDVPEELINMLREKNYHYMGIVAGQEYARTYSPEALYSCHVLGYVGPISQDSYSTLSQFGYSSDDSVGKSGVESQMERYLHGDSGITPYNIWTTEGEEGFFVPANYGIKPKSGATVNLTIDTRIQEVGTEALKDYIK